MKFVFTCGGTAGHINPALAVAGRLKELMPDSAFLFIGVNDKMEMELVPRAGYEIRGLDMTYIVRGHDLHAIAQNLETLRNVARSTREAKALLRDFAPDAVIGTGGYICYPVLTAAHDLKIPTLVHESNAVPGLTTKLLADKVDRVMLGFEESRQYYRRPERVVVTAVVAIISGFADSLWPLAVGMIVIAVLANITAFWRVAHCYKVLKERDGKQD